MSFQPPPKSKSSVSRLDRIEQSMREVLASKMIEYSSLFEGCMLTVVRVSCSPDLKNAQVFVSVYDPQNRDDDFEETVMETLEEKRAELQNQISKKIRMKNCPKLKFVKDGSIDKLVHVSDILNEDK